jgi:hypothetical protein
VSVELGYTTRWGLTGPDTPSLTGESTYIIPRTTPGAVLLGGTFQVHNWDVSVDMAVARGILERCTALQPALQDPETRIVSHNVGLRPARTGGPRVEVQWTDLEPSTAKPALLTPWYDTPAQGKVMVIHAYGFGYVIQSQNAHVLIKPQTRWVSELVGCCTGSVKALGGSVSTALTPNTVGWLVSRQEPSY